MEPNHLKAYVTLGLMLIAWCVLHSAMITVSVTEYLKRRFAPYFPFYRLFYNIISIATLIPVAFLAYALKTEAIVSWSGYLRIGQAALLGLAAWLFYLGGRYYDARQLLGTRQIKERTAHTAISETGELETSGILGITRHPWYLAAMLLLWARSMDIAGLLVNLIFTVYLIAGAALEEKKLVREFGADYIAYQQNVSMLIPVKWIKLMITR